MVERARPPADAKDHTILPQPANLRRGADPQVPAEEEPQGSFTRIFLFLLDFDIFAGSQTLGVSGKY